MILRILTFVVIILAPWQALSEVAEPNPCNGSKSFPCSEIGFEIIGDLEIERAKAISSLIDLEPHEDILRMELLPQKKTKVKVTVGSYRDAQNESRSYGGGRDMVDKLKSGIWVKSRIVNSWIY